MKISDIHQRHKATLSELNELTMRIVPDMLAVETRALKFNRMWMISPYVIILLIEILVGSISPLTIVFFALFVYKDTVTQRSIKRIERLQQIADQAKKTDDLHSLIISAQTIEAFVNTHWFKLYFVGYPPIKEPYIAA